MASYWLDLSSSPAFYGSSADSYETANAQTLDSKWTKKETRLVNWITELLLKHIQDIVARQDPTVDEYIAAVRDNIEKFSGTEVCEETWECLKARLDYVKVDMRDEASYSAFKEHVNPETGVKRLLRR